MNLVDLYWNSALYLSWTLNLYNAECWEISDAGAVYIFGITARASLAMKDTWAWANNKKKKNRDKRLEDKWKDFEMIFIIKKIKEKQHNT